MIFDYSKLLGKIAECKLNQTLLSKAIGKDKSTVNAKLNGKGSFNSVEIVKICETVDIPKEKIPEYFFSYSCSETLTE